MVSKMSDKEAVEAERMAVVARSGCLPRGARGRCLSRLIDESAVLE